jgi:perosamine synthetase
LIPVNRPLLEQEDVAAVNTALGQTFLSGETPPVREFEELLADYLGVRGAVCVSNGTDAIDLSVEALGIRAGDECIVPSFTIISTCNQLMRVGAKIVLVDSDDVTWSMDAAQCVASVSEKTKVILPVHIYGLPVDMFPITQKATSLGVPVLEDAAEALGVLVNDKPCGSIGSLGTFSFYANKIITSGEGGAIVGNDPKLLEKIRLLRNLHFDPQNRFVHSEIGWNSRLSGIQAALLSTQLRRIDKLISRKREIGRLYREGLKDHPWLQLQPQFTANSENNYWVVGAILNEESPFNAAEFQLALREHGIDTRRFFCPMHLQPLFKDYSFVVNSSLSVSEKLWNRGIYFPSGLGNTNTEIERVIEVLWSFC